MIISIPCVQYVLVNGELNANKLYYPILLLQTFNEDCVHYKVWFKPMVVVLQVRRNGSFGGSHCAIEPSGPYSASR